jgi:dephospho-CoA kinase
LVGPVCAGKSLVAKRLERHGARLYEADALVRQLYDEPPVREQVRQLFGAGVFQSDGSVNRAAIADRIFGATGDAELRRRLTEEVIFPRTGQRLRAKLDEFRASAAAGDVLVLDAPTLFEAGRSDWCDRILWVTAPMEQRRLWATARGWAPGELERRDAAMLPESAKRARADFVIENNGSQADLDAAADRVWNQLASESQSGLEKK